MKKTFIIVTATLLILFCLSSCAQDTDGIMRSIVDSSAKSKYICVSYLGEYEGSSYVLTNNKGIIYFKINDNHTTNNIKTVKLGDYKAIHYASLNGNTLKAITADGTLLTLDLSTGDYEKNTADNYKLLSKIGDAVKTADGSVKSITGVNRILWDGSDEYYITSDKVYINGETPLELGSITPDKIYNFAKSDSVVFVTVLSESDYVIYKLDGNTLDTETSYGKLSSLPTAAFAIPGDDKIAYKTMSTIDILDISDKSIEKNKTDGWAKNIYTSSTEIAEFVSINNSIYSVNESGGMLYIDLDNNKTAPVFTD